MSSRDLSRIDEVYHAMYKKTCLEAVDPDAGELARHQREERDRESARTRDYYPRYRRSYGSRWDNDDAPSSRSGAYDDDYHGEDEEYNAKAKAHAPEAAKAIINKLKLEYGDKYNHQKGKAAVKRALGSATEEDCESWMQDYSHAPEQKKEMARYAKSPEGEAAEEPHCKYAEQGCDCGECEGCQDNAMKG
jgi:hypothetical protein